MIKKALPLLFLTSCMLGPDYKAPEIAVTETWSDTEEVNQKWWELFEDPLLTKYIEQAAECNYDLLTAEANILRARATRQIVGSNLFPHIGTDWSARKTYFSKNGPLFAFPGSTSKDTSGLPFSAQVPQTQNLFNALFDASWELDLFGKTRRAVEAVDALIEREIDQRSEILLTVYAEVSRNYMELRSYQQQKLLLEERVTILAEKTKITADRLATGYSNQLELEQSEKVLQEANAQLPQITAEIFKSIYTLSILTGKMPDYLAEELLEIKPLPKAPPEIHAGLKSDLLKRRPDVRKAERALAAATATIGVAVASFFPTVDLMGLIGFQSLKLPELLNWGSRTFAYGADLSMPLYEGGRLTGQLHLTQAEEVSAAHAYQQTVLNALENAESALVAYNQKLKAASFQKEALSKAEISLEITSLRYQYGLIDKLILLNYQDQLVQSQLADLERDTSSVLSSIALYKALGGGWE